MKYHSRSRRSQAPASSARLSIERLEPRLVLDASLLRITEFVASNDESLLDYDGDSSDWLEIYNSGNDTVNLAGMYLTDKADNLTKWAFPAGTTLDAGGYMVVFASNKNTVKPNGELHTNFALSAGGEYLGLVASNGTTVIDSYTPSFPAQLEDVSYGVAMSATGTTTTLIATGATGKAWVPTSSVYDATWKSVEFNDAAFTITGPTGFGFENNPGDAVNFTAEIGTYIPSGTSSLYLRVPFTLTSLAGYDRLTLRMRYDDGFVAYLNGVEVAQALAPEVHQWNSVGTANHDDTLAEQFESFDITAGIPQLRVGQNVLAIHAMNVSTTSSDMLISPELTATKAGIITPIDRGYFVTPTPGFANGDTSYAGFLTQPTFSVPHGFYTTTQSVSITGATPGSIIVYTTNGSTPAVDANLNVTNGIRYTGPISISATTTLRASAFKTDFKPSFVTSSTYLFVNDIINQSPQGQTPAGWAPNGLNGQVMDYGIDPDIITMYGAQAVKNSLLSIPSISITTDLPNLFDPSTGIYVNALNRGKPWERASTVELIDPAGVESFTVNAGLRIRGGWSRNDFDPKHAFRFYFRGEYGDSKLNYALFGDEGADEFDVLDLRCEQNYSWSSEGNYQNSMVREVFSRDLMEDLNQSTTRSRYYHLYLDGVYWGVYMTQERVEEFYGETYFGGDESDYDVVKHGLGDVGGTELSAGNELAWQQLFTMSEQLSNNFRVYGDNYWTLQGLNPDGTRNPNLPVLLDVDNLISFVSIIFFTGGYDTGISYFLGDNKANNWFGIYNRVAADQGFQFFVHDNEHSLGAGNPIHSTLSIDRTGPFNLGNQSNYDQFNPQYLHQDLMSHPEYRQRFIDFVQKEFYNGGAFTLANNLARINERIAQVEPAVIAESARWGDAQLSTPANKTNWQNEINWILNTYFPARAGLVLSQLRNDGLFTNFSAPSFSQHGGNVSPGFQLTMTASAGTIYYTTDGVTDPRLIGNGINPSAAVKTYSGPVSLAGDTLVKARLRTSTGQWSGLVEATFNMLATPGDYNADTHVNGFDFLLWQRGFGSTVVPSGGGADGNQDGTVNGADLTVWSNNYGTSSGVANLVDGVTSLIALSSDVWIDSAFLDQPPVAVHETAVLDIAFEEIEMASAAPPQNATASETPADSDWCFSADDTTGDEVDLLFADAEEWMLLGAVL